MYRNIEQNGKADHQVNPGGAEGKCLEGREAIDLRKKIF
jgi:hypothetical protein